MWMELEGIMLSEISHTEKDKYCMISFICGIEKKKKTQNQKVQTQRCREQIGSCQVWGREKWVKVKGKSFHI